MSKLLKGPDGAVHEVPDDLVDASLARGYSSMGDAEATTFETTPAASDSVGDQVVAGVGSGLSSATLGLSDAFVSAVGPKGATDYLAKTRRDNPIASTVGGVVGSFTGAGAAAGKLGASIAKTAAGASLGTKVGRAALGYGVEGAIQGVGQTVSDVVLSEEPLDIERVGSMLSSNVLLGGGISAGTGALGHLAGKALVKAKGALDDVAKRGAVVGALDDDLAQIAARDGAKGLRVAREAEETAIEAARVPQRAQLADDIGTYRAQTNESKIFLATKDADVKGIGEIRKMAKVNLDADRQLDRLLNKGTANLGENLKPALGVLQQQENALTRIAKSDPELRAVFAADKTATRAAALDAIPSALEQNRGLQTRIREMMVKPTSQRLTSIADAIDNAATGAAPKGMGEQMLSGAAYSGVAGLAYASGLPGASMIAPFLGAKAAGMVGSKVFGRLGKGATEAAARASKGISAFLNVAEKVAPAVPVLASKVLAGVRYSQERDTKAKAEKVKAGSKRAAPDLATSYKARSEELRAQTAYGPTGAPVMRHEARMAMASRLDPIRTMQPILADRLETLAARRVEFLASKLPRRPDFGQLQAGPDRWQPSDMEMRGFARYAAAVEDPHAIVDRLADGSVTPEDAEAMKTVYPEMFADVKRQIIEGLPELRESLPFERRLALSIFSGVPVDPSMDPRVFSVLQASFANEPGTEGGTQAPQPSPAFGSVKNQEATASQQRAGVEA